MPNRDAVVLVSYEGTPLGESEKQRAHEQPGRLHLAFSVFLFRPDGSMLLQRRARSKYHFPGIWANACCSHPEPGEELVSSARRRLGEELGLDCELADVGTFTYRAVDPHSGLVEHEFDHVLVGEGELGEISPAPDEVEEVRFVRPEEVTSAGPKEGFAPWFAEALAIALEGRRRLSSAGA